MKAYHLTPAKNIKQIQSKGLIPKNGRRSRFVGDRRKLIYLFKDIDSVIFSYKNETWPKLISSKIALFEVDIDNKYILYSDYSLELLYKNEISPEKIKLITNDFHGQL